MNRLSIINFTFLLLIAALLCVRLYLDYGRPYLVLKNNSTIYSSHYVACERAIESENYLLGDELGLSSRIRNQLVKSITIEKLSCDEKDLIKETILSAGVRPERINAIEISSGLKTL